MPISVLIVDDHRVVAEAFAIRLSREPDIEVIGITDFIWSALAIVDKWDPDVVVVDPELREESGLELARMIEEKHPRSRVVVLTAHGDLRCAAAAVHTGARGFVPKGAASEDLVAAVRGVVRGETHIPPDLLTGVLHGLRNPEELCTPSESLVRRLSDRERELLEHMVAGHDRATAAAAMFVSLHTVRTHAKHILAKLGVHSSLQAVAVALQAGVRPHSEV